MKILFNHPVREVNIPGPKRVQDLLKELDLIPESVLVIRGDDLVTEDDTLRDEDCVEIRPVISGGAGEKASSRPEPGWAGEMGIIHALS